MFKFGYTRRELQAWHNGRASVTVRDFEIELLIAVIIGIVIGKFIP